MTTNVIFICHGNICRSTMAQCVMQHYVNERGLADQFVIDSAAATRDALGFPIFPPARAKLEAEGIPYLWHTARLLRPTEVRYWDYIVCMDEENVRHLKQIVGDENMDKVAKLLSFAGDKSDVADPWFTDDFDTTYDDLTRGCKALLDHILESNPA
ncbi:MAG: low molecular weight protein-tyrosine-phosphatase [Coriobacteriales bacterium]|nr:low molecular weight protein-tyrosine-phosphatase [Coriobacteriales bacterium]